MSNNTTSTQNPTAKHEDSQADIRLWSDFLGRSQRVRSASSASETLTQASFQDEGATVDELLAEYRSKEAERRKNSVGVPATATASSKPESKTQYGQPIHALLNRVGGIFGDMMDGEGWRRT